MSTFQQVLNDARVLLNDVIFDDTTMPRYTDVQLMVYARQAVVETRRVRPDLFLSNLTTDFPAFTPTNDIPIPEQYVVPLVDYVVARAEMRDDEFAVDGRATALLKKFKAGLVSV